MEADELVDDGTVDASVVPFLKAAVEYQQGNSSTIFEAIDATLRELNTLLDGDKAAPTKREDRPTPTPVRRAPAAPVGKGKKTLTTEMSWRLPGRGKHYMFL